MRKLISLCYLVFLKCGSCSVKSKSSGININDNIEDLVITVVVEETSNV